MAYDRHARIGGLGRSAIGMSSYSTSFAGTENPIVEDGGWLNGDLDGTDWSNMESTPGKAFGTQNDTAPPYDDSVLLRKGIWPPNQDIRGRVFITSRSGWTGYHEVECLRGIITPGSCKLIEVLFSTTGSTTYCQIMKWNGPVGQEIGDFTELAVNSSFAPLNDGDWVRAVFDGGYVTGYTKRGAGASVQEIQANIQNEVGPYANGAPGYGHWKNGDGAASTYGLSEWSVTSWHD